MSDFSPSEQARRIIRKQLLALKQIVEEVDEFRDTNLGFEQLRRWKELTVELLKEHVNEREGQALASKRLGSFIMGEPLRNLGSEVSLYHAFLTALNRELQKNPERFLLENAPTREIAAIPVSARTSSRTVFLIHGHDELNLLRLRQLLKADWDLDSIVLKDEPGMGRTLIEKFEEEAVAANFAMALLSPDDVVQGSSASYPQARPNVVFELGWFYGRLGRERVCILRHEDTTIHSDLNGISRIDFKDSVEEISGAIAKELKAAGLI